MPLQEQNKTNEGSEEGKNPRGTRLTFNDTFNK